MTGGYVDLEQVRWDLQVATGQTVAGSGVEGRMREARAAAGRLAAGLPGLLDELEQLRPLPAELADARATVERVCAAWADVIQRQQRADNAHRYDVEEITGRAVAAERALEAVREWAMVNEIAEPPLDWAGLGAALSATSPTTSDDEDDEHVILRPEALTEWFDAYGVRLMTVGEDGDWLALGHVEPLRMIAAMRKAARVHLRLDDEETFGDAAYRGASLAVVEHLRAYFTEHHECGWWAHWGDDGQEHPAAVDVTVWRA